MTEQRDVIADLMRVAGRRPEPPRADRDAVLLAATDAWQQAVRGRKWRRVAWALAASVSLVAITALLVEKRSAEPDLLAEFGAVKSLQGEIAVQDASDARWRPLHDGERLGAGARIRTQQAAAAFVVPGTGSIRLQSDTLVALQGPARMNLLSGTVYIDVDDASHGQGLAIETPFGVARDIGTVFELATAGNELRLRVRDGRVELGQPDGATVFEATAGEELRLSRDGSIRRQAIDRTSPEWRWAERLAKPFNPEGRPLSEFLRWVARETGRRLRFRSARDEALANSAVLHGTTRNLAPMDALDLMLATTDFEYALAPDSVLVVGRRTTTP